MPMLDDAAAHASLANDYGTTRGANAADSHEVELWDGNPTVAGSAQLPLTNGYAPATILPADWSAPAGRRTQALATFPAPTGAWPSAPYWVLRGDDGFGWDYGTFTEAVDVTGAGTGPQALVVVYYPSNN